MNRTRIFWSALTLTLASTPLAFAQLNSGQPQILSTNQTITPLAPRGATYQALNPQVASVPDYTVGQAVTTVVSPDGKTLLILTSGFNLWAYTDGPSRGKQNPEASSEWVFVFDISSPKPVQKQAIAVPNTYSGIAFSPDGTEFYVTGGDDDNVHIFALADGSWSEKALRSRWDIWPRSIRTTVTTEASASKPSRRLRVLRSRATAKQS